MPTVRICQCLSNRCGSKLRKKNFEGEQQNLETLVTKFFQATATLHSASKALSYLINSKAGRLAGGAISVHPCQSSSEQLAYFIKKVSENVGIKLTQTTQEAETSSPEQHNHRYCQD
jgi:tRNA(Ile)-lysidine synthase TilS/MesJ